MTTGLAVLLAATLLACEGETLATVSPISHDAPPSASASSIAAPRMIGWTRDDAGIIHDITARPAHPLAKHEGWVVGALGNPITWAHFLNGVHSRFHPLVADKYLIGVLDTLPRGDPRNDPQLRARLELAFDPAGNLAVLRVVRSSGVALFDAEIVDAVRRAAPFPIPPIELRSPDANVYAEWEMHRDETFACSTMNARPWRFVMAVEDGGAP